MIRITEFTLDLWVAYVVLWYDYELEYERFMSAVTAAVR